MKNIFDTREYSDLSGLSLDKLIKLRDRVSGNILSMECELKKDRARREDILNEIEKRSRNKEK